MKNIFTAGFAFIGGVLATLVGAGILFPPNYWEDPLTKQATAFVEVDLPSTDYEREISIEGFFSGEATANNSRMSVEIKINEDICNNPNPIYKNPNTSSTLEGSDFCLYVISPNEDTNIIVGSGEQTNIDSTLARMQIRVRKSKRGLF